MGKNTIACPIIPCKDEPSKGSDAMIKELPAEALQRIRNILAESIARNIIESSLAMIHKSSDTEEAVAY